MAAALIGVLLGPLIGALGLAARGLFFRSAPSSTRRFFLFVAAVVCLCALTLPFYGDREVHLPLTWLPGSGDLSLHVGGVGVYALIATAGCAFLLRWFAPDPGPENRVSSLWTDVVWLAAWAATNAAFLAGHFLGRYVVLEVVGLCVALLPLIQRRDGAAARFVYIVLRIGDAGFLAAILMLLQAGGTLTIAEALRVAESLDASRRGWIAAGFLLAAWVKLGAWPFQDWLKAGDLADSPAGVWLYGIAAPNLGLYLLYRIAPLLGLSEPARWGAVCLGAIGMLWMAFRLARRPDRSTFPVYVNAVLSGGLLLLAAGGAQAWLGVWLWAGTAARWAAWQLWRMRTGAAALPVPPVVLDPDRWLDGTARSIRRVETGVFERGLAGIARGSMALAATLLRVVEQDGLETLVRATAHGTRRVARRMQRMHTGRLRVNLAWVAAAWALVVVWLALRSW